MTTIEIPFHNYVRNIRCSAQTAAVLAVRLVKTAPPGITPEIEAALRLIGVRAEEVAAVQSERDRLGPARLRPVLSSFANGWGALHETLLATSRVPSSVSNRGARGTAILNSVFPDGITFVLLE